MCACMYVCMYPSHEGFDPSIKWTNGSISIRNSYSRAVDCFAITLCFPLPSVFLSFRFISSLGRYSTISSSIRLRPNSQAHAYRTTIIITGARRYGVNLILVVAFYRRIALLRSRQRQRWTAKGQKSISRCTTTISHRRRRRRSDESSAPDR